MAKKSTDNQRSDLQPQTFSLLAPGASSVQLVGDFTDWQKFPIEMYKSTSDVWQVTVKLENGPHYYRFLVDGEWRDDPGCDVRAPNDFGSQNMIRTVG
jgi:1,4-alpha-glucan branching enzyme